MTTKRTHRKKPYEDITYCGKPIYKPENKKQKERKLDNWGVLVNCRVCMNAMTAESHKMYNDPDEDITDYFESEKPKVITHI